MDEMPLCTRLPAADAKLIGECVTAYSQTPTSSSAILSAAS
jgi:hypothetical protein